MEELATAMLHRLDRVDPPNWMRSLEGAAVVDSEPDDLGVIIDKDGVHPVRDDGIDRRTRSRVHRFELRRTWGLTADVVHRSMV